MPIKTNAFLSYILDKLEAVGQVHARMMFGGYGLFMHEIMFGIVIYDELYFKVGDNNRPDFEDVSTGPLIYAGKHKPVTLSYWRVPEYVIEKEIVFQRWVEAAYKAAIDAQEGKKKHAKRI